MNVSRSRGDLQGAGQELPGPVDGLALEVVAEAEVAQHLEERHVARGLADVLDVAGADALLAGGGALEVGVAQAHELALELVHPGRREEHGRVVGHEHVARPADAALGGEEVEVRFAEFVGGHGAVAVLGCRGARSGLRIALDGRVSGPQGRCGVGIGPTTRDRCACARDDSVGHPSGVRRHFDRDRALVGLERDGPLRARRRPWRTRGGCARVLPSTWRMTWPVLRPARRRASPPRPR